MHQPVEVAQRPLPWEGREPLYNVRGFTAKATNLHINLGYAVYEGGSVLLYALETIGGGAPTQWRLLWTTKERALDMAESLCADVEEYLDSMRMPWRPVEDLDMDDYIEHLRTRIAGTFH